MYYNTYEKSYNELLILNREKSIHHKHLNFLAKEVYKLVNTLYPSTLPYEQKKGNK